MAWKGAPMNAFRSCTRRSARAGAILCVLTLALMLPAPAGAGMYERSSQAMASFSACSA